MFSKGVVAVLEQDSERLGLDWLSFSALDLQALSNLRSLRCRLHHRCPWRRKSDSDEVKPVEAAVFAFFRGDDRAGLEETGLFEPRLLPGLLAGDSSRTPCWTA